MADTFRDWIPAGEDTGAQGNVFKDFVPPTPETKVEPKQEVPVEAQTFKCDKCDFVAKSEFGLKAHSRKHEIK